jgi:hypothetical protein
VQLSRPWLREGFPATGYLDGEMELFTRELVDATRPPSAVAADTIGTVTVPLARAGFALEGQTATALTFVRTYRTTLTWVMTVVTFPFGLLFYLAGAEKAYITITFEPQGDGTLMRISGEGPAEVKRAFETLSL